MKSIVLFLFIFLSIGVNAQRIRVESITRINTPSNRSYTVSAISPDGGMIAVTSPDYSGLELIDLSGRSAAVVSDKRGSGYQPVFSGNGKFIFYKEKYSENGFSYSSLCYTDLKSGEKGTIEQRSRSLTSPRPVREAGVLYSSAGVTKVGNDSNKSLPSEAVVALEDLIPVLYREQERTILKPCGEGPYIWASLSPDKTLLLFSHRGTKTYVCDLDGKIVATPGRINAPRWLDNNIIVGMDDHDDGYRITSSEIVCYDLRNKEEIRLTSTGNIIEMYPLPVAGMDALVFQDTEGGLFIMNLKIRR